VNDQRLKSLVRGTALEPIARRLYRIARPDISVSPPVQHAPFVPSTEKPFALPSGLSEEDLRQIFLSFSLDGGPVGQMDPYFYDAFFRFMHSWEAVRDDKGRCLELGANPYFITWLLHEHTDLELTLANYFGGPESKGRQTLSWLDGGQRTEVVLEFDHFNSEEDRFPYDDASFDVVIYCEIIEHLLMNPVHTLKEIRRVLRPSGKLLVTTPNVARFENLMALAAGRSIYDPYSGFGPYGRHNREYSIGELIHLLRFCGFSEESTFTADAHSHDFSGDPLFARACRLARDRPHSLGQYLFAIVRATEPPQPGLPASLFRSYPDGDLNTDW
jgi:hypothetical protein